MLTKLQIQIERLGGWWCRVQHRSVGWPMHSEYECVTCCRRYPVPWAEREAVCRLRPMLVRNRQLAIVARSPDKQRYQRFKGKGVREFIPYGPNTNVESAAPPMSPRSSGGLVKSAAD